MSTILEFAHEILVMKQEIDPSIFPLLHQLMSKVYHI